MSSLSAEYQAGSPILLEKIKVCLSFLSFVSMLSVFFLSCRCFHLLVGTGQSVCCNQANKRRWKLLLP